MQSTLRICFLLLALLQTPIGFSQAIEWQNTIGGTGQDRLHSAFQTSDGGYVLNGCSWSGISGDKSEISYGEDYWIVKIDAFGNILWEQTINANGQDYLMASCAALDGGIVVAGYTSSDSLMDKNENSNGGFDYWVVKTDSLGNIQWQNTLGGSGDEYLYDIKATNDGGYIIAGRSESPASGDKSENSYGAFDFWIVKLNQNGGIVWENTIGGNGEDWAYTVIQTNDNGYLVGGYSNSGISGEKTDTTRGGQDYWILKLNSSGVIQWQKTIGGAFGDYLRAVEQTYDSGFLLGGYSYSSISGEKTENSNGDSDYWIVKTDSTGNILWQNTIGGSGKDNLLRIHQYSDGEIILSGDSDSGISGDKFSFNQGDRDYWLVLCDSVGMMKWERNVGGSLYDANFGMSPTPDHGILAAGYSISNISGDKDEDCMGFYDYWTVKINAKFNTIKGNVFYDINSNLTFDPGEPTPDFINIIENNTSLFTFTNVNGNYALYVPDSGQYQVQPYFSNSYFSAVPATHSVQFSGTLQTDSLNDFALQPTGSYNDLCVTITPTGAFRTNANGIYTINYHNNGTTILNPTIVFYPDTNVAFISASLVPTSITPDSVIFNIGTLNPFQSGAFTIVVHINFGLQIGTPINSGAAILPVAGDVNPGCNLNYWEIYTTGSLDPNDILVNRTTLPDTVFPAPPFLEYIIRFQNTGNDTAFYVKIENPLPATLIPATTEIITTSHPCAIDFDSYENKLKFTFLNILLPDSNTNEPESHGFVRYRIKPLNSLTISDTIINNARIYFDYNTPVLTNDAITAIVTTTGISEHSTNPNIDCYPNPVLNDLNINFELLQPQTIKAGLYNLYGQKIRQLFNQTFTDGKQELKINLVDLPSGIYLIKVEGDFSRTIRIVKI